MPINQVVILAGGLGTRLKPITQVMPKPMVEVGGSPFLEVLVERLKRRGFDDFIMLVGHLGDQIIRHFADGSEFGVKIRYSVEKELLGTGGALKQAEPLLAERFMVVYGDSYLPLDYSEPMLAFESSGKAGLITVYSNHPRIARNNVEVGGDGIVKLYEKSAETQAMNGVEAGVFFLERQTLNCLEPGKFSLEQALFPKLIKRGELMGFMTSVRFWDIGTPDGLEAARRTLHDLD
ncbi:MAG: nucleotidyltransferase family protein [Methanobacteriota archaeon]